MPAPQDSPVDIYSVTGPLIVSLPVTLRPHSVLAAAFPAVGYASQLPRGAGVWLLEPGDYGRIGFFPRCAIEQHDCVCATWSTDIEVAEDL